MTVSKKGLSKLDFDETKEIAEQVGFDIKAKAKRLRSCGPGPKYYENDKRFFVLMLVKHIEKLKEKSFLSKKVLVWHEQTQQAISEYKEIEKKPGAPGKRTSYS
jgi:inorganic pyrophosphatase/exopolyphosphatase